MKTISIRLYWKAGKAIAELNDVEGVSTGATGQGSSEDEAIINLGTVVTRMKDTRRNELFAPIRETKTQTA